MRALVGVLGCSLSRNSAAGGVWCREVACVGGVGLRCVRWAHRCRVCALPKWNRSHTAAQKVAPARLGRRPFSGMRSGARCSDAPGSIPYG